MSFLGEQENSSNYLRITGRVTDGPYVEDYGDFKTGIVDVDFENQLVKIRFGIAVSQEFNEEGFTDEIPADIYKRVVIVYDVVVPFTALYRVGTPIVQEDGSYGIPVAEVKDNSWSMPLPDTDN